MECRYPRTSGSDFLILRQLVQDSLNTDGENRLYRKIICPSWIECQLDVASTTTNGCKRNVTYKKYNIIHVRKQCGGKKISV